ncbi:MAG: LysM peptidoglycan-binding domain-containing protein [Bacteroidia bacterium]|nr:LysM peptidoglycan-binding domain-containing protein [Bacteroidia bacterium]
MRREVFFLILLGGCFGQPTQSPAVRLPDSTLLRPDTFFSFLRLESNNLTFAAHLIPVWKKLQAGTQKVRVLHIGDSHIQGDIQGREIRRRLYKFWGVGGRGYVFPYHVAGTSSAYDYVSFGQGQWLSARSVQPQPALPLGVTGIALGTYDPTAWWEIKWNPAYQPVGSAGARLYILTRTLKPGIACALTLEEGSPPIIKEIPAGYGITELTLSGPISGIHGEWRWAPDDTLGYAELQGIFIEEGHGGITWYSMGIVGARLSDWATLPLLRESLRLLAPDLVVIDLGTNDLYPHTASLQAYRYAIEAAIDTIRSAIPEASILLTTPQDFYRSMRPLPLLEQASQMVRWVASQKGVAVWDAYNILGSIREWRLAGLASADMIHLTVAGYALKGQMLASAFLRSYQAYVLGHLPVPDSERVGLTLPAEAATSASNPSPAPIALTPSITQFGGGRMGENVATYSPPRPTYIYHKVKAGETLGQIAERYKTSVAAIRQANGLRRNVIRAGQTLRIPSGRNTPSQVHSASKSTSTGTSKKTHIVRAGESLWSIAQKYGISVDALRRANGMTSHSAIYPGQKLSIP